MNGRRNATNEAIWRNMALVATTVRWDEATYEWIRNEARDADLTVAQFVREATIMRALLRAAHRDAPGVSMDYIALASEVERRTAVRKT
jgi:hypothetical protein